MIKILDNLDVAGLLFILVALAIGAYLWHIDHEKDNKFYLINFVTDANGRADKYSLGYVLILLVGCWIMFYLAIHDRLTEWFVTSFLGAFVIGAIVKTGANAFERTQKSKADTPGG